MRTEFTSIRWKFPICFIELPPQGINRSPSCDYIYYVFIVCFLHLSNVITAQRPRQSLRAAYRVLQNSLCCICQPYAKKQHLL